MWTSRSTGKGPVDKPGSSPICANSSFGLAVRFCGIIPGIHTLYDYDKGIS
jgi:hypothetical protein